MSYLITLLQIQATIITTTNTATTSSNNPHNHQTIHHTTDCTEAATSLSVSEKDCQRERAQCGNNWFYFSCSPCKRGSQTIHLTWLLAWRCVVCPFWARLAFDYKNPADVRKALSRILWHVALCSFLFRRNRANKCLLPILLLYIKRKQQLKRFL